MILCYGADTLQIFQCVMRAELLVILQEDTGKCIEQTHLLTDC